MHTGGVEVGVDEGGVRVDHAEATKSMEVMES